MAHVEKLVIHDHKVDRFAVDLNFKLQTGWHLDGQVYATRNGSETIHWAKLNRLVKEELNETPAKT